MERLINLIKQKDYDNFKTKIDAAKTIAIFSHKSPDGDTVGSAVALANYLKSLGKKVFLVCQDIIPERFQFVKGAQNFKQDAQICDLAISTDCAVPSKLSELFFLHKQTISIDHHHKTNPEYAKLNLIYNFSSTAEIVYLLTKKLGWDIESGSAEAIYMGLCDDTNSFSNTNTNQITFLVASELAKKNIDINKIYNMLFGSKTTSQIYAYNRAVKNCRFDFKDGVAISYITLKQMKKINATSDDLKDFVTYLLNTQNIKIAALITQKPKYCSCSLRSIGDIDCIKIAGKFGGGGHFNAAGCRKENVSVKKFVKEIYNYIKIYLNSGS